MAIAAPRAPVSPFLTAPGLHPPERSYGGVNTNARYWVKSGLRGDGLALTGESGNNASAPHIAAYSITGDIEIVLRLMVPRNTSAAQTLLSNLNGIAGGFEVQMDTSGRFVFSFGNGVGTGSYVSTLTLPGDQIFWVKMTRVSATGASAAYYAPDQPTEPTDWITGSTGASTGSAIGAASTPMYVGTRGGTSQHAIGGFYRAIVRNGIGGTTVFDADFSAQVLGASSFVESSANAATVTINGSTAGLHDGRLLCNGSVANLSAAYVADPNGLTTVTSDIDLRCLCAPSDWTPSVQYTFVARWGGSGSNTRAYAFNLNTNGTLSFQGNDNTNNVSANSSVATGFADGSKKWVRVTWRASDSRAQFFTCDGAITDPAPGDWVQLGTNQTVSALLTALYPTTSPITIGESNTTIGFVGSIYRAQVYNGIAGTCVVDADFSNAPSDTSWFPENANGLTVHVAGGAAVAAAPGFGTWSTTATLTNHWATRSNGYPGASIPNSAIDVVFDRYSGHGTVTLGATVSVRSFSSEDAAYAFAQSSFSIQVGDASGGSWTYGSRTSTSGSGAPIFISTSNNGGSLWPITTNGVSFPNGIAFNGAGGAWKFMDAVTVASRSAAITHTAGTLDFNSQTITSPFGFTSSGAIARRLIAGTSTFNITSSSGNWQVSGSAYTMSCDNMTINFGTGVLLNVAGATTGTLLTGTNVTYGTVGFYGVQTTASVSALISGQAAGNSVINNLIIVGSNQNLAGGTPGFSWGSNFTTSTVVINNMTIRGFNASQPVLVASGNGSSGLISTGGTALSVNVVNPPTLSDVIFVDTVAAGTSGTWTGTRLQDGGGNSNITFPASQTNYWVPTAGRMTGSSIYLGSDNAKAGWARTPTNAAYNTNTTDLDIKVKADFDAVGVIVARDYGASTVPWNFGMTTARQPYLRFLGTAYASGTLLPYNAVCCRATWNKATGLIDFYWSADPDPETATWTRLGAQLTLSGGTVAGPATAISNTGALGIIVGDYNSAGSQVTKYTRDIQKVVVIQGGSQIFNADFAAQVAGTTTFSETSSLAATVTTSFPTASGTGNWSDPWHWSTSTGGAVGTGRMPYAQDDMKSDANAGTGTITQDRLFLGRTWDFTNSTITSVSNGGWGAGAVMWGSIIIPATVNYRNTAAQSGQILYMKGRASLSIDTNGNFWGNTGGSANNFTSLKVDNLGQAVTFLSDFNAPTTQLINANSASILTGSSLVNTNKTITVSSVSDIGATTARTIDFGTGTWNLTSTSGTVMSLPNQANLTILGTPNFVVAETLDGVVSGGAYRIPQPGTPPSNVTVLTGLIGGNNWWETWAATGSQYTGDLDIRVKLKRDFWTDAGNAVNIIGKQSASPGLQWNINCPLAGTPTFTASLNGTTQPINVAASSTGQSVIGNGVAGWIRFTRVASTGAYAWYYSLDATNDPTAVSWTSWGSGTATSGALFNSTAAPLVVGHGGAAATTVKGLSYYYAGVSTSVASWTPAAEIDFSSMADYALSYTDSQSNVWRNHQASMATSSVGGRRVVGGTLMGLTGLTGDMWQTPDTAALSITGDIDIQVRARATNWATGSGCLVAKYASGNGSFYLFQGGGNGLTLQLNNVAASGTQALINSSLPTASGGVIVNGWQGWLRVTWRQSDGRVQFFYANDSSSVPSSWTQLGGDRTIAIASIYDSTAPVEIGSAIGASPFVGYIHRARILSGIGGTVAFDADFSTLQDDTFAFKESSANLAIVRNTNGTNSAPNRVVNNLDVNKNLPGTITATPSSRVLYFHPITNSLTFPAISITGGKWVKSSQNFTYVPASLTLVSTATGPRSAYFSATDASIATTSTGGTVNVQYADIYNSIAAGASIPFIARQGFDAGGNTNWLFLGMPYSTLPMMGV